MQKIFFHNNILDSGPVTKLILIKSLSFFCKIRNTAQTVRVLPGASLSLTNEISLRSLLLRPIYQIQPILNPYNREVSIFPHRITEIEIPLMR